MILLIKNLFLERINSNIWLFYRDVLYLKKF